MKVGVITFHRAINYGAALQTYALQVALKQIGVESEVIDYRCEHTENLYRVFKFTTPKQFIRLFINIPWAISKKKSFRNFLSTNVKLSDSVYYRNNIKEANDVYDTFITGSDQVFNYACSNFDKSYFLDFAINSKKKNSYAASFSISEIPHEYKKDYIDLLKDFNHFSIREESGQRILHDLVGRDSELNVDPVFLLSKSDWSAIAKKPSIDKYILIYQLNESTLIDSFARKLAKMTGYKIISINCDVVESIKHRDFHCLKDASIEEFVGLFKYAEYVVTNSFHGTAFSVLFNKKLFAEAKQKDFKPNHRIETLLKITDLTNCIISNLDDCVLTVNWDFKKANQTLLEEKNKSIAYLKEVIGDAKKNN